jgi:hypothetical protein
MHVHPSSFPSSVGMPLASSSDRPKLSTVASSHLSPGGQHPIDLALPVLWNMLRNNTVKTEYGEAPLHESTSLSMRIVGTGKVIGLTPPSASRNRRRCLRARREHGRAYPERSESSGGTRRAAPSPSC